MACAPHKNVAYKQLGALGELLDGNESWDQCLCKEQRKM